ncbi:A24 family peptidase [Serratia marcescens]|uniref:A24 family peptidase n=1 Tax=Serratia marcescens TaxID=615 RepID=UPI000E2CD03B|nr:prepilin peptidase [Serratia marcescens]
MITTWLLRIDFVFIAILLVIIAWGDIMLRLISHRDLLILSVLLILAMLVQHQVPNFIAAGVVLIVGFFLFTAKIIGGGDVKFISALSLTIRGPVLIDFLMAVAFLGGIVVLIGLLFFRKSVRESGVPYAVPISLAFILTYPVSPFF